jgi:hypothetical protein
MAQHRQHTQSQVPLVVADRGRLVRVAGAVRDVSCAEVVKPLIDHLAQRQAAIGR